jgi:sugar/nucleoside kinase (ribokinase family)
VAAIGLCSWDRFLVTDSYPGPGEYAVVQQQFEQAGGTTSNTCAALARLGIEVALSSRIGADREGRAIVASLAEVGCDVRYLREASDTPTDGSYIVISGQGEAVDRTIFWIKGAKPESGDHLPLDDLLEYRWLLIDVDDPKLRSFLLDLPAHRSPRTKLIGLMTYLVETPPDEGFAHLLRFDVGIGNARELRTLTHAKSTAEAVARAQAALPGHACTALFISDGPRGSLAIRAEDVTEAPAYRIEVVDTTGAGDAFAAGCIWGLLESCPDAELLRRGNALGALACRALGARAGLPSLAEAQALLGQATAMP